MPKNSDEVVERYLAISRAIAGQLDYETVLSQVAKEVDGLFHPDHMDVAIILPDRKDCSVSFEVGVRTGWSLKKDPAPLSISPIRSLLWGEVPNLLTGDACEDERFHFDGAFDAPIFDAQLRSRLHVPLRIQGVVHGSLNISSHEKDKYTQDDVEAAQQIADLLAPYIYALIRADQAKNAARAEGTARAREESLRLGALRLTEGMEKERRRIGMDLHDQTLADLTRISRHVSRLGRRHAGMASEMAKLNGEISTCISELRRIIEDTKPGVMELFGFAQAVEAQLERSVAGIVPAIRTEVRDSCSSLLDACPESLRTTLFRIVQEAINNAIKHSRPSRLVVSIDSDARFLTVAVRDNGSGIVAENRRSTGGLDHMRVRAALISAEIAFLPNQRYGGTRVVVNLPLRELHVESAVPTDTANVRPEALYVSAPDDGGNRIWRT